MIPNYDILTTEQVKRVDEEALRILAEVGVEFEYQPALELLQEHGVKVDGQIARFEPGFVKARIAEAPSEFTLRARNPELSLKCGGDGLILTPSYGPPFIYGPDGSRRQSLLADYDNIVKLAHTSKSINHTGGNVCEPNDVPTGYRHLKMLESHVRYSDKPFMGSAYGVEGAADSIEIAKILFGDGQAIAERPVLNTLINSITPLKFDERMIGALMTYAAAGQSSMVSSLVMSGSTGPVTMAETLAIQNAEVLAGIALAQCVRPGAPCIMGSTSGPANMCTMALSIGTAETALYTAATAQMARFYGIPSRGGGGLNDSILPDAQAGYESMLTLFAAASSGINYVLHAAGIMHYYNAFSYEKFVIDDEIAGLVRKFMDGYCFAEDHFVFEDVREVGPGGHFLYQESTLNFARELRVPLLSCRDEYDTWQAAGSHGASERATAVCAKRLADYQQPELDAEVDKALSAFIERRCQELS